jgi:hypothetical protein
LDQERSALRGEGAQFLAPGRCEREHALVRTPALLDDAPAQQPVSFELLIMGTHSTC